MAEIATIARPYAEALFKAAGNEGEALKGPLNALALLAGNAELRQFADNPKVAPTQVFDLVAGVALQKGLAIDPKLANLLRTVIDNGRLAALPEVATQFQALVNGSSGVSDCVVESAFAIEPGQMGDVIAALEKRFGRKLNVSVKIAPELIGGIRASVGDEVLDTSVLSRLQQMKTALTA
jgi:F-type H+-transporting ATPase subunit delta